MPFICNPQANISEWRPHRGSFNAETDRLRVTTNWADVVVLAWSSDDANAGWFVLAPETIPANIRSYFGDKLNDFEYSPGEFMKPQLFVYQIGENLLRIELGHPKYEAVIQLAGHVIDVQSVRRGPRNRSSSEVRYYQRGGGIMLRDSSQHVS